MGSLNVVFTEEEREGFYEIILEELKSGENRNLRIAEKIGISTATVRRFRNELIKNGKITDEEIESAAKKRELQEKSQDKYRARVLECLRCGLSIKEIAKKLGIGEKKVFNIRKALIEEGEMTEKEIEEAVIERKDKERQITVQIVLSGLRKGEKYKEIAENVDIGVEAIKKLVSELIKEGLITREEIDNARENRKEKAKEEDRTEIKYDELLKTRVLKLLLLGIETTTICEVLGINNHVFNLVKEDLIKERKYKQCKNKRGKRREKSKK